MRIAHSATVALLLGSSAAFAFPTEEIPTSEAAYIAKVKTGAPEHIVAKATIVMMKDGKETTLQTGSNGYTCLIDNFGTPLCADEDRLHLPAGGRHRDHQPRSLCSGIAPALGADRPACDDRWPER